MKKWWSCLFVMVLFCTATVFPSVTSGEELPGKNRYRANVQIDPLSKHVEGSINILFRPQDPSQIYLHVYPYAFAEKKQGEQWEQLLGKDALPGAYAITKLSVEGHPVEPKRQGTLLEVSLESAKDAVEKAGQVRLELHFEMTLPRNNGRMSYDDHALWLGNWLPVLAVHDKQGWNLEPYEPIGDPFYSENADYQIQVTLPDHYQLASTAADQEAMIKATAQGQKTYQLEAGDVRDFALVIMDQTYQKLETKADHTQVRTWFRSSDNAVAAKRQHEAAWQSLAYFNSQFGAYPYREFDVVRTGGAINGMEYPAIVFVDGSHFFSERESTVHTVVHETAHQWFYGIVGNNQWKDAWLDEGLTEYAAIAFLSAKDPQYGAYRVWDRMLRGTTVSSYIEANLRPWQPLSAFPDNRSYGDLVYSRPFSMMWMLRDTWGEKKLHAFLKEYVRTYRFGVATGEDWIALLTAEAGADAKDFIDYWLYLNPKKRTAAENWLEKQRQ